MLTDFAPAKINLWLHVTGRREDGYHTLDSLVAFASVGDRLAAAESDTLSLVIKGPFADALGADDDNLILKAAEKLAEAAGCPAHGALVLEKNLPVTSGIGGGSADAAAALRLCKQLWDIDIDQQRLAEVALALGADVPVCLKSDTVRMTGIGESLKVLDTVPPAQAAVLVNPGASVPTGQVFALLSGRFSSLASETQGATFADLASKARNDLEAPAIQVAPVVADVLKALRQNPSCQLARMSGSGATCFGLFSDQRTAHRAAAALKRDHPDWWVSACKIG